jgi:hypothetical protein
MLDKHGERHALIGSLDIRMIADVHFDARLRQPALSEHLL